MHRIGAGRVAHLQRVREHPEVGSCEDGCYFAANSCCIENLERHTAVHCPPIPERCLVTPSGNKSREDRCTRAKKFGLLAKKGASGYAPHIIEPLRTEQGLHLHAMLALHTMVSIHGFLRRDGSWSLVQSRLGMLSPENVTRHVDVTDWKLPCHTNRAPTRLYSLSTTPQPADTVTRGRSINSNSSPSRKKTNLASPRQPVKGGAPDDTAECCRLVNFPTHHRAA